MNRAFELLLAELEDDAGLTDAEVEAELKAAGVDLRSARTKLDATLLQVENANRRQRLDRARRERLSSGSRDRLADVRAHAYPLTELHAQQSREEGHVNEHYQNFDEMTRGDLVTHLVNVEGRDPEIAEDTVENMRECAWVCYAGHCGLEYFRGTLMQFGDGGYPYLYLSPADGGDDLCHVCATKEFKKGASVAWSYHMEGEVEHCADCGAEIKPFAFETKKPHLLYPYEVGVDPAGGGDFQGLTLVMDGQVIGSITSVSFVPSNLPSVAAVEGGYAVPGAHSGELQLGATKVNWPLLVKIFEEQHEGALSEKERAWLEEMRKMPNEFGDDEETGP